MAASKKSLFTPNQNKMAELAKALGHPARIAIVEYLLRTKGCVCGDIVEELPLSQSTVSQHLRALKQVGVIKGEVEGTSVCYCIDQKNWREAAELVSSLFMRLDRCC
ncbi:MAG: metalloregulator ArsR/SmtB family transcription factor [Bacteroidota bacterium]